MAVIGATSILGSRYEWLKQRQKTMQASETAGLFGVGYSGQNNCTIYAGKVCEITDEVDTANHLIYGNLFEPSLVKIASHELGMSVVAEPKNTIRLHPGNDFMGASIDAWAVEESGKRIPCELKLVGNFAISEWRDDTTPLKFFIQCQHQMACTSSARCVLVGVVAGEHRSEVRWIDRNVEFIGRMTEKIKEFWSDHVLAGVMPEPDNSVATATALNMLHPDDDGTAVAMPAEIDSWLSEMSTARAKKKEAEATIREAQNWIRVSLRDHAYGVTPDGKVVSWKTQERKECVTKASKSRVLRVVNKLPTGVELLTGK